MIGLVEAAGWNSFPANRLLPAEGKMPSGQPAGRRRYDRPVRDGFRSYYSM